MCNQQKVCIQKMYKELKFKKHALLAVAKNGNIKIEVFLTKKATL